MNKNDQTFMAQKIRSQYMEKESTELDALRGLDTKVKKPANIFAYVFGIIGSLVLGTGMSFAMNVIEPGTYFGITIGESMMIPGIIIGIIGIFMVSICYPLYKRILNSRKKKYANQILELSEKIMHN